METNCVQPEDDSDILAEDNTRPSLPEDFPNFRYFQIEKMVQHFRVVTDGSEQRLRLGFKCKICSEVFNKTMQLLGHIRNHFEENHSCRDCGKYFFDTNKLHIHKRAKHTQALKCQLGCPSYTTSNLKCLQTHYLRYHCLKIRSREMKKLEDTFGPFHQPIKTDKIRIQREQAVDRHRQLPTVKLNLEDDEEEEEELEQEQEQEGEPDQDDEDFDEYEDVGQTVECCVCDVYIPSEEDRQVHEDTHSSPYTCKICSTSFEQLCDARNHYDAHEKTQVMQSPMQMHTVTVSPVSVQHQVQHTSIPLVTTASQPHVPTPNVTTMIIMHNGTPILVPVQTFDSSQLVPAFQSQQIPAQINAQPATATTTITPISTAWPISQLLPVNNQIEIIPIHSATPVSASTAATSSTASLNPAAQAIPIQNLINVRHDQNSPGGIVITPVTTMDQNYLGQQQVLQAQLQQLQQQQQHQQQPQSQQKQHYPTQS